MAQIHVLILGNRENEVRIGTACTPPIPSDLIAELTERHLRERFGEGVRVTYADVADPEARAQYYDWVRLAFDRGLRYPLVILNDRAVVLEGNADPTAVERAIRRWQEEG